MKDFKTLLENACEDYFSQFEREPSVEEIGDVIRVCEDKIAIIALKAVKNARVNRNAFIRPVADTEKAYLTLSLVARSLLGKPVGTQIGTLHCLFKDAQRYNLEFSYGTIDGQHHNLQHNTNDTQHIVAYHLEKIKNFN